MVRHVFTGACRLAKLKELIFAQTKLDPKFQEIFYENLPYKPATPIMASQLPATTVTIYIASFFHIILMANVGIGESCVWS